MSPTVVFHYSLNTLPALAGNGGEAAGAEPLAADEDELPEPVEGLGEEGEVFVGDGHALQVDLLEPAVRRGEGGGPGVEVGAPVGRHQIEVREPRLALHGDGPDPAEPGRCAARGDRVAVPDEELGSGEGLRTVPGPADQ